MNRSCLTINRAEVKKLKECFRAAQRYVDNECLRCMTPYVPVGLPIYENSGKLRDSGKRLYPGKIVYTAKKARHDYYNRKVDHRHGGNPNATPLWFETMKKKHGRAILRGTAAILGGKAK